MRAVLEFSLPEDSVDHKDALNGWKYKGCLREISNYIRLKINHGDITDAEEEIYQEIRDKLSEIITEDYEVTIWD